MKNSLPKKPVKAYVLPLSAMTEEERLQIKAYLSYGSFREASRHCGFHRQTISDTWHRWRKSLSEVFLEQKPSQ